MANTRVFSWKIDGEKYGYLYIPGKTNLISNRITENAILTEIANVVKGWSLSQYQQAFSNLNSQLMTAYKVSIQGNASDYYGKEVSDYIILTGVDGTSYGPEKPMLSTEEMEEITRSISLNITEAKNELNDEFVQFKTETNLTMDSFSGIVKTEIENATDILSAQTEEMMQMFSGAVDTFSAATEIFNLKALGIDSEKIEESINKTDETYEWVQEYKPISQNITNDIVDIKDSINDNTNDISILKSNMSSFSGVVVNSLSAITVQIADIEKEIPSITAETAEQRNEVNWDNITNKPNFATVAMTGSYNDLTDKPTISGGSVDISGKYDKTGGTISGDVKVEGLFTIDIDDEDYDSGINFSGSLNNDVGVILSLQGYADNTVYKPIIRNIGNPVSDYDAATKKYVDENSEAPKYHLVELNLDGSVRQKSSTLTYASVYQRVTDYKKMDFLDVIWENGQGTNQFTRFHVPCIGITEVNNGNIIFIGNVFYQGNGQNMTLIFSLDTGDTLTTVLSLPTQETFLNKVQNVSSNSASTQYYPSTKAVFDEFQRKPVVVWKASNENEMLGSTESDITTGTPAWQLTGLDMTQFKRVKIYTKCGKKSSGVGVEASATPAFVIEMSLDSMAASPYNGHFVGSAVVQKPNDSNRLATICCAISSDKTKFIVLRMTSLYGTGATANSDANGLVFMIEGYYD